MALALQELHSACPMSHLLTIHVSLMLPQVPTHDDVALLSNMHRLRSLTITAQRCLKEDSRHRQPSLDPLADLTELSHLELGFLPDLDGSGILDGLSRLRRLKLLQLPVPGHQVNGIRHQALEHALFMLSE